MVHLPKCPRCQNEWQSDDIRMLDSNGDEKWYCLICKACNVKFVAGHTECFLAYRDFLGREGYHLGWGMRGYCYYGNLEEHIMGTDIKLPLLPYNITPARLRLLLTYL